MFTGFLLPFFAGFSPVVDDLFCPGCVAVGQVVRTTITVIDKEIGANPGEVHGFCPVRLRAADPVARYRKPRHLRVEAGSSLLNFKVFAPLAHIPDALGVFFPKLYRPPKVAFR